MVSGDYGALSSSVSILLGVLTYFLTLTNDGATRLLNKGVPAKEQTEARKTLRAECHKFLFTAQAPVVGGLLLLSYLCFPTAFAVVKTSFFHLWNFDLPRTLFVFLQLGIVGCFGFSLYLAVRVLRRAWKLRPGA